MLFRATVLALMAAITLLVFTPMAEYYDMKGREDMAELTKSGVCYNLKGSPYSVWYGGFTFYFSSVTHQRNFMEKCRIRCEWMRDSMTRRFHMDVDMGALPLFQLYMQVERRGFYVVSDRGHEYRSHKDVGFKVVETCLN